MELLEQFKTYLLQKKETPNKITVKNYVADVRKFIRWFETRFVRAFSPRLVTKEVVDDFKTQLSSHESQLQVVSASSLKRYLSSLRKFYQFLLEQQIVSFNPFDTNSMESIQPIDRWHIKAFKNYLYLSHASKPTIKNYLMDVRQFITWFETVSPASTASQGQETAFPRIGSKVIEEYKNRLVYDARFEPRSVNRKLSSLRKYFSWAKQSGILQSSPQFTQAQVQQQPESPIEPVSLNDLQDIITAPQAKESQSQAAYSSFPPLRLLQKLGRGSSWIFDLLIIGPVVAGVMNIKYQFWKLTGKQVFAPLSTVLPEVNQGATHLAKIQSVPTVKMTTVPVSGIDAFITSHNKPLFAGINNLPKSVYAPLSISTADFTFHKKIIHHVRHTRPAWYKKYHSYRIVHYIHFGIALVYASLLGFMVYQGITQVQHFQAPVLASLPGSPPRMLAFEGTLTDETNTPITAEQTLRFGLYNSPTASGSSMLWEETQVIQPDNNGNFKTLLGKNKPIYQRLLSDNPTLFLGLTIGREEELAPRQQIATTMYSQDSERLQGLLPITQPDAGTRNVILALDSAGDLIIGGSSSPRFEATGGEFTIAGRTLTLTTTAGSSSNIQIVPDGSGIVDIQKPIQNTTNYSSIPGIEGAVEIADSVAIVATTSGQSALYINQNSIGDLISASSSGLAKFTVDQLGRGTFASDVAVNGNNLTTVSTNFNLLNRNVVNLNFAGDASNISIGSSSGQTTINNRLLANNGLNIPSGKDLILEGLTSGAIPFVGSDKQMVQDSDNFVWAQDSKRLGLGTNTPEFRIDVRDSQDSNAVAQIYNTATSGTSRGLDIKLGSTSPGPANSFIRFLNGNGVELGAITGSASGAIAYKTNNADYAEYYKKARITEHFEQGDVVCLSSNGGVTKCTGTTQPLLGVVSATAGFVGAGDRADDPEYVLVGIVGQLPVKVVSEGTTIASGDPLTVGPDGRVMKATKPAMIVGHALTSIDSADIQMVQVALNVGWYDPTLAVNQHGDVLTQQYDQLQDNPTILDGIIENITLGMIEATSITTQSLSIATENITIGSLTLREYVTAIAKETTRELENQFFTRKLISPVAEIAQVKTNIISPLAEDAEIAMQFNESEINIINPNISSTSAVASIDNEGNASFSGTLRAKKIIADEIEGLNIPTATVAANYITNVTNIYNYASQSAGTPPTDAQTLAANTQPLEPEELLETEQLAAALPEGEEAAEFATFNQGLMALAGSSFTDIGVTGTLRVGESLVVEEGSINTIGTELAFQPLRQGNITFMGGLITIDTQGNAVFNEDVTVHGKFAANVIVPVPNQDLLMQLPVSESGEESKFEIQTGTGSAALTVNQYGDVVASGSGNFGNVAAKSFTIIRGAQADTSFTTTVAEGSGGTAVITANERERTIISPYIKPTSLIYVSPTSPTYGVTPYIARQTANSFTIQIPYPVTKDIKLNWWIVN